jgi:hypothetical protein
MKIFLLLSLLVGCTQKYVDYDLIRKVDFNRQTYDRPIPVTQVLANGNDSLKSCFHQWLFFSNAEKEKDDAIPMMIRSLCPGKDYLISTELTERWWTTIIYTQSCVNLITKCGEQKGIKEKH